MQRTAHRGLGWLHLVARDTIHSSCRRSLVGQVSYSACFDNSMSSASNGRELGIDVRRQATSSSILISGIGRGGFSMAIPVINFNGDGTLTVCCGPEPCAVIRVGTTQAAATTPVARSIPQPTPIKPTIAYADVLKAMEAEQTDVIAGDIHLYVEPETGVMALAMADGGHVRLDVLGDISDRFGVTPVVQVGASVLERALADA